MKRRRIPLTVKALATVCWQRRQPTKTILPGDRVHWTSVEKPSGLWASWGKSISTWFPKPIEVAACCRDLRLPPQSGKFPATLLHHCRTLRHVRHLVTMGLAGEPVPKDIDKVIRLFIGSDDDLTLAQVENILVVQNKLEAA